jgi:hypothetical protein
MKESSMTRRDILHVIGSAGAMVGMSDTALAQTHPHPDGAKTAQPAPYSRKVFDDHQWLAVRTLCDLIIPADERSGSATGAGVPEFIDDWLAFRKQEDGNDDFAAQILGGLAWLDQEAARLCGKAFAGAPSAVQKQILDRIAWPGRAAPEDRRWAAFFSKFRDLTVSGFFSSKIGIAELPYLGNTAVAEWKGCDPEIWAVVEERIRNGYKGVGGEVKPWE